VLASVTPQLKVSAPKPITILGGGLAGLTLGIGLRRQGIPVTVIEAGHYPRHRVCGEFVSGRGQDVLTRLGLREALLQAGALPARTGAFFLDKTSSPVRPLPSPALCLSRFIMDALLARLFRDAGGELCANERWRGEDSAEGVVRATGRRLEAPGDGWRWFGLKLHARKVPLEADLEIHGTQNGYVGLCRLQDGEVNACGLFRRPAGGHDGSVPSRELLRGQPGTPLHQRMAGAEIDPASCCAVAGLSLRAQRASARPDCSIGDALTMIPPVTGNGMSMAFEAAEMAVAPLTAYSRGELTWAQAHQAIARACDDAFAQRLVWARWLQWMMFTPALRTTLGALVLNSDWLWRTIFAHTR
jgi:2-polyprenyl-6-methoxyphenol hydroxylase-like FAD-dependent oxidoreductase